jgi:hypothetical protein
VAIAAALCIGVVSGHPIAGVLAASGAFLVGLGAALELFGSNVLVLTLAAVGLGVSAIAGSLVAAHGALAVLLVGTLGALCGVAASRSAAWGWIAVRLALAGIVATGYPASLPAAAHRAMFIAAGGLAQTFALALAHLAGYRAAPAAPAERADRRFALHLAAGLALGLALERPLSIRYGYWVPMTTLIVLRPNAQSTIARALARSAGTLAGVGVAFALVATTQPRPLVLGVLVVAAAFGAYAFQRATYGVFAGCVSAYVLFVLSLGGSPERQLAVARTLATLLGSAVGIAVQTVDQAVSKRWAREL